MRDGFINTCARCEHIELCHALVIISFDDYIPGSPGYIPLMLCNDKHSEVTFPDEQYTKGYNHVPEKTTSKTDNRAKILQYLDDTRGELITSTDIMNELTVKHRPTTNLLSKMTAEGLVARYRAGSMFYYTLPGVHLNLENSVDGETIRASIVEALQHENLTTKDIFRIIGVRITVDAVRNHIYRLERKGVVARLASRLNKNAITWELV